MAPIVNVIISLLPFLLCASLPVHAVSSVSGFNVTLTYDGSFEIRVGDKPWFTSTTPFLVADGVRYGVDGPVVLPGELPIMDAPLVWTAAAWADGKDALGSYRGVNYTYYANSTRLFLTIRAYDSMVVFTQAFPDGLKNTGVPDKRKILSGYPGFEWSIAFQSFIASGYLTFSGPLDGVRSVRKGRWEPWQQNVADGREASGPLCLFNVSSSDAVIISPLTKVMTLSPWHRYWPTSGFGTEGQSYWGIDRDIQTLPQGYKAEVILVYSPYGVGQVFEDWGDALRRYYGQGAPAAHWSTGLDKVGYWTGPGSFYYDNTGQNTTYEDVILEVEKNANIQRVPFGFLELDNWWYESKANRSEAIVTWAANNNSLPDGLWKFEQPLVVVCSAWSSNTTYAEQNNGSYSFLVEGDYSLPTEQKFWADLFNNASLNNVTHVYYDFMSEQYGGVSDFQQQAELAGEWLTNVSQAAVKAGVTLTFSQGLPSMLLAAAQLPAVTQARVSERYSTIDSHQQWDIGLTSLLPVALGLAPFKDTFWSHSKEHGYPHSGSEERNPALQALVATLSTGLVAVGDSADAIKSSLLAWCCRSDGVVLRPSTPAVAIDDHIVQSALGASAGSAATRHVWKSLSTINVVGNETGVYHQGIIVAVNTSGGYKVTPEMIFPRLFKDQKKLRLWSVDSDNGSIFWQDFSQGRPLSFPKECWDVRGATLPCLFHVSMTLTVHGGLTDVHLCGEVNKFVPLSPQRVLLVNITAGVTLTLAGEPGETLTFDYYVNDQRRQNDVTIAPNGLATLALNLTWVTTTTASTSTKTTSAVVPTTTSQPSCASSLNWLGGHFPLVVFAMFLSLSCCHVSVS